MTTHKRLLVRAGAGIGTEVMGEVERVADRLDRQRAVSFDHEHGLVGGSSYVKHGTPLTDEMMADAMAADALLLRAVGGPNCDGLPFEKKPECGLLRMRKEMELFANLRPALVFEAL